MTISITAPEASQGQDLLTLDLYPELTVAGLKELIKSDTNFSPASQHLYHNGELMTDGKTLADLRIVEGDMLAMHVRDMSGQAPIAAGGRPAGNPRQQQQQPRRSQGGRRGPEEPDPETIRLQILGNARMRTEVQNQNPELASAIENPERFRAIFRELQRHQNEAERARELEIARLNDNPFDLEAQAKIAEIIRNERVMENLQYAMEHNSEGKYIQSLLWN